MEPAKGTQEHLKPPDPTAFPCSLTISVPLPTHRLASSALRALQVDAELSALVRRSFSLTASEEAFSRTGDGDPPLNGSGDSIGTAQGGVTTANDVLEESKTVLTTVYHATTNRMLRVAVNGFLESLGVVLGVMEELDVDVLMEIKKSKEGQLSHIVLIS